MSRKITIIAGEFKGRRINSIFSHKIRPLLSRIRKSLFDILGESVKNKNFLDFYAGTGSVGFEALSRGAKIAHFVENDRDAINVLKKNASYLGVEDRTKIFFESDFSFVKNGIKNFYDFAFIGPPYKMTVSSEIIEELLKKMKKSGILIFQHHVKEKLPEKIGELNCLREKKYGKTCLSFFSL